MVGSFIIADQTVTDFKAQIKLRSLLVHSPPTEVALIITHKYFFPPPAVTDQHHKAACGQLSFTGAFSLLFQMTVAVHCCYINNIVSAFRFNPNSQFEFYLLFRCWEWLERQSTGKGVGSSGLFHLKPQVQKQPLWAGLKQAAYRQEPALGCTRWRHVELLTSLKRL